MSRQVGRVTHPEVVLLDVALAQTALLGLLLGLAGTGREPACPRPTTVGLISYKHKTSQWKPVFERYRDFISLSYITPCTTAPGLTDHNRN